jgi:hypothetical protein
MSAQGHGPGNQIDPFLFFRFIPIFCDISAGFFYIREKEEATMSFAKRKSFPVPVACALALAVLALAAHADVPQVRPTRPNLAVLPDFQVADIEFTFTRHIIAKVRNNSPSPFSGDVEIALQIAGYGLVYRNRVFHLDLPARGTVVPVAMPCDLPAEKMRMADVNAVQIKVSIDPDRKIPELNDDNNGMDKRFPLGVIAMKLELIPDSYNGPCDATAPVRTVARISFRGNMTVTERYKIVLEDPDRGYRKEYRNEDFVVTVNNGSHTVSKEIVLPAELAAQIQHGTEKVNLRAELFWPAKNMASNTAVFTYRCL